MKSHLRHLGSFFSGEARTEAPREWSMATAVMSSQADLPRTFNR